MASMGLQSYYSPHISSQLEAKTETVRGVSGRKLNVFGAIIIFQPDNFYDDLLAW